LTASVRSVAAQSDPRDQTFARLRDTQKKLGSSVILSGGARNLFALANNWDRTTAQFARMSADAESLMMSAMMPGLVSAPPASSKRD
jgi:hypothetical protein